MFQEQAHACGHNNRDAATRQKWRERRSAKRHLPINKVHTGFDRLAPDCKHDGILRTGVHNSTNVVLPPAVNSLLTRVLKFAPPPQDSTINAIMNSFDDFASVLRLEQFMASRDNTPRPSWHVRTGWRPFIASPYLETWIDNTTNRQSPLARNARPYNNTNLSPKELVALTSFRTVTQTSPSTLLTTT